MEIKNFDEYVKKVAKAIDGVQSAYLLINWPKAHGIQVELNPIGHDLESLRTIFNMVGIYNINKSQDDPSVVLSAEFYATDYGIVGGFEYEDCVERIFDGSNRAS